MGTVISILLFAAACSMSRFADQPPVADNHGSTPVDWRQLEQRLKSDDCAEPLSYTGIQKCAVFDRFTRLDAGVLMEMVSRHDDYPLVTLAAFFAIKHAYPDRAPMTALRIVATTERPLLMLHASLYEEIGTVTSPEDVHRLLDWMSTLPFLKIDNLACILGHVNCTGAWSWYHRTDRPACSTSFEAMVFDSIVNCHTKEGQPMSALMSKRLRHYMTVPGMPMLVFLTHTGPDQPGFGRTIAAVFSDESIDTMDLAALLVWHTDYIKRHVDLEALDMPIERLESIRGMLHHIDATRAQYKGPSNRPNTDDD